jgi:hypothetical protein
VIHQQALFFYSRIISKFFYSPVGNNIHFQGKMMISVKFRTLVFFVGILFCVIPGFASASSDNATIREVCWIDDVNGTISLSAEGDLSYVNTETIRFYGENSITGVTYLFLTGPHLSPAGVKLSSTKAVVTNNQPESFDIVNTDPAKKCKWEFQWTPDDNDLEGTYVIYAVSAPLDKNHLINRKYQSFSFILKSSGETPTMQKTVKIPDTTDPTTETTVPVTTDFPDTVSTEPPTPEFSGTVIQTSPATMPSPTRMKSTIQVPTPLPTMTPTQESPVFPELVVISLVCTLVMFSRVRKN